MANIHWKCLLGAVGKFVGLCLAWAVGITIAFLIVGIIGHIVQQCYLAGMLWLKILAWAVAIGVGGFMLFVICYGLWSDLIYPQIREYYDECVKSKGEAPTKGDPLNGKE